MYTEINFQTEKALREAFKEGHKIGVYQPGTIYPSQREGQVSVEGPHYPQPHTWYASVLIKNGVIIKILS